MSEYNDLQSIVCVEPGSQSVAVAYYWIVSCNWNLQDYTNYGCKQKDVENSPQVKVWCYFLPTAWTLFEINKD